MDKRKFNLVLLIVTAGLLSACHAAAVEQLKISTTESQVIDECLERFGGLTHENADRLQRYKKWSESYEEIPCFTNCYLGKMFDFYNETRGEFVPQNVISKFGQPLFDACKDRMIHGRDHCELAYKGFHCIVSLENDPFVLIERMEKLNNEAKTAMKDCLRKFDQFEWDRFNEFSKFPVREPIPCFTKCFIDKLQLFNERTRQWNIAGLRNKLGVPADSANTSNCGQMVRMRNRNVCNWMYQEFTCLVMAKEEL